MQGSSLARLGACGLLQGRPGGDTAQGRAQPVGEELDSSKIFNTIKNPSISAGDF